MRFTNRISQWLPATLVLSGVNLSLLAVLLVRDWNFRRWLFKWELHTGPNTLSDHALAMHLGLLQATVVGIGVGITVASVIGYRSLQEEAVKKADKEAKTIAETVAQETAELVAQQAIDDIVETLLDVPAFEDQQDHSAQDERDPFN